MKLVVFTGPTLSAEEARKELDALYLPPVAQGEVYRAALERPWAIGIIDGYFERVPSVWHKEILWAMSQGIHVFGSASMGALRAAELAAFGMEGVGAIYEDFQRGTLQDDDEVAVTQGTEEEGHRALSEAMVDIRATLRRAEEEAVISSPVGTRLERIAKSLFFAERVYPRILAAATREGLPEEELAAFREWVFHGRVNLKRADALAMLRVMRERREVAPGPKQVHFSFEHTDAWEALRREAAKLPSGPVPEEGIPREALLEELRLEGCYATVSRLALARALALDEARRQGLHHDDESLLRTEHALREALGVTDPNRFRQWLEENGVEDFQRLLRDEAGVHWIQGMFAPELEQSLPDHLRITGKYVGLLARARNKQRVLREQGLDALTLETARTPPGEPWRWYFGTRLRRSIPADLEDYARTAGFEDAQALEVAVLRDWLYVCALGAG
ncbi:TfuA-like protein [Stigmatella sp. ncwal1]|uniref:TfuA-like protein n=1 Tax=Stigmatella ashevillensis TaxID=2995309 RepID=A0ABT5DHP6_9BACT|nr:TfuA-like protein [Stigmatella ashevillena]MDC0713182.1 TfuA-like protein [Stigmatella ashevillena]